MRNRFNKVLALTLCLALSISIMTPVFAFESDASQTSPVKLTAQPIVFNVGVPTGLPVSVDAKGNVTVATDAKITNTSAAPIMIAGVQVKPITDWNIVPMNKDFKSSKIGTKEFGFVLNNDEVPSSGAMTLTKTNWPSVNGGSILPLSYNSVVAPQKDAIAGSKIADVVFTIGWDVNDFTLSSESLSLEKGSSSKLNLLGVDSAIWSSSNESVATVDETGLVRPLDWGTTTITATANGVSKTCEVTVPKVFNGLTLNASNIELYETQTQQLVATDKYRSVTTWSSSNENIATVDSNGLITGKTVGTAIITALKGGFSVECNVKVNPIELSNSTLSLEKGKTSQLTLLSGFTAIWTSSDASIATVDQTGNITALNWGTTTITANVNGVILTCEVTVPKIQTGLDLDITSKTLKLNETVQLTATSKYRATTIWTSSNPEMATVDSNGLVTGISGGTSTITATQGEFSATCNINVEFPVGTKYIEGNYEYSYGQYYSNGWINSRLSGWGVRIINNAQTSYSQPLEEVNGWPVMSYAYLFSSYPNSTLTLNGTWTNKNVFSMEGMFWSSQATSIIGLNHFDTPNVAYMSSMFMGSKAISLDLSNFDTSNVIKMNDMFSSSQATSLNLSSFNTSKITYMSSMFYKSQAKSLDLRSFNTSNVTNMSKMFEEAQATSLDLSSFNTSNVTNMCGMFYNSQATTLDLSSFNTSNVTDMSNMFSNSQATSLDLSSFDTSKVTNMDYMFSGSQATTLNLSNFSTSKVVGMSYMFSESKAISLDLSNFDTSKVTNMSGMFYGYQSTSLNLSSFNTSNVINMSYMFTDSQAPSLDLSSFDTSKVANMKYMFWESQTTTGYAKTQADADKFNGSSAKPSALTFIVKAI